MKLLEPIEPASIPAFPVLLVSSTVTLAAGRLGIVSDKGSLQRVVNRLHDRVHHRGGAVRDDSLIQSIMGFDSFITGLIFIEGPSIRSYSQ